MSAGPFLFAKSGVLNKKRSLAPLPFTSGVRVETLNVGRTFFVFKVRSFKQKAVSRAPSISRFSEKSNSENLGISVFPNFRINSQNFGNFCFSEIMEIRKNEKAGVRALSAAPKRNRRAAFYGKTAALRFTAISPRGSLTVARRFTAKLPRSGLRRPRQREREQIERERDQSHCSGCS